MPNNNSKFKNDSLDLKAFTFECFSTAIEILKSGEIEGISIGENTSVLILTDIGLVEGTIMMKNPANTNPNERFAHFVMTNTINAFNEQLDKIKSENSALSIINNSDSIILKNVVITPYSNPGSKINLATLILFTDKILGISFGEKVERVD